MNARNIIAAFAALVVSVGAFLGVSCATASAAPATPISATVSTAAAPESVSFAEAPVPVSVPRCGEWSHPELRGGRWVCSQSQLDPQRRHRHHHRNHRNGGHGAHGGHHHH